jgi:hypothetical protein
MGLYLAKARKKRKEGSNELARFDMPKGEKEVGNERK